MAEKFGIQQHSLKFFSLKNQESSSTQTCMNNQESDTGSSPRWTSNYLSELIRYLNEHLS